MKQHNYTQQAEELLQEIRNLVQQKQDIYNQLRLNLADYSSRYMKKALLDEIEAFEAVAKRTLDSVEALPIHKPELPSIDSLFEPKDPNDVWEVMMMKESELRYQEHPEEFSDVISLRDSLYKQQAAFCDSLNGLTVATMNLTKRNFLLVSSRKSKDIQAIANALGSVSRDLISKISGFSLIIDLAATINETLNDGLDYSDMDKKMAYIEAHTAELLLVKMAFDEPDKYKEIIESIALVADESCSDTMK